MNRLWFAAAIVCLFGPQALAEDTDGLRTAGCPSGLETKIVPLPVYSTLPNEGSTFGTMPVFLRVCEANGRTNSIIAPSVTWNDVIHATGTFRVFHYPSEDKTLTFIASLNEWSEGHYLEPDTRFGLGWLEAVKAARGRPAAAR